MKIDETYVHLNKRARLAYYGYLNTFSLFVETRSKIRKNNEKLA